jgi:hypothetical protein
MGKTPNTEREVPNTRLQAAEKIPAPNSNVSMFA